MAKKHDGDVLFALYTGTKYMDFFLCPVSDNATEEKLGKQKFCRRSPSDGKIEQFGSSQFGFGTSFVSVGSMVYCIGGRKEDGDIGNKVRKMEKV